MYTPMNRKNSKDEILPRGIVINELPLTIKPSEVLNKINYGSIESCSITDGSATLIFFSYLDLYLTIKDIQQNNSFTSYYVVSTPIKYNLRNAHLCGATRCVMISDSIGLLDQITSNSMLFGETDEVISENGNVIVKFLEIKTALKFVKKYHSDVQYRNKISFYPDPCSNKKYVQNSFLDSSFYVKNRTIYLGGIHSDISPEDIFNVVKGGDVLSLKLLRDKKCAFVDFINYHSANVFLAYSLLNDCTINKKIESNNGINTIQYKLKVSRGIETTVPLITVLQCFAGATRAILLSNNCETLTTKKLLEDFGKYGEIEMINFIKVKKIVFINFMNINDSYNAFQHLKNDIEYKEKYRITFGRDRCSNETMDELMRSVIKKKMDDSKT
ncbi:hypothetical protein EDEG_00564 [Edhazardia aedis USNM 41457]|uniref:RRM domain-containing protein n=1 Tax=Edhazardia aedis (strain USNM 41457) TaxID=1003232 RepID=J9D0V3_EDHAE|nr:hypothetical protein EDEG_00564 [Edhazardia aedis USNM 41457]|eukprot:EJW01204.1 hypothetical protein EDEG_00564 [Edhazardia aedis USNM 41457]